VSLLIKKNINILKIKNFKYYFFKKKKKKEKKRGTGSHPLWGGGARVTPKLHFFF
jgi:hypothetical protein